MSKITQNYIEARRDGIKWLNSQKRDYSTGVNILTRSGYKGFVAARLALSLIHISEPTRP